MKVYDEAPSGRHLPTLQQIRQANLRKIFEEEGAGILVMIIGIVLKKPIVNPTMLDKVLFQKGVWEDSAQIVKSLTQGFVLVHGVSNLAI